MSILTPTLRKSTAKTFLDKDTAYSGDPSSTIKTLGSDNAIYRQVDSIMDSRLLTTAHSFQVVSVEIVSAVKAQSREFKTKLEKKQDSEIRFLFHGTRTANHDSIFDNGFLLDEEHFGDTDAGYIGKGVYLTPGPEYCASYIKDTAGITKYKYGEPVQVGVQFQVLGCIAIVGTTQQKMKKEVGMVIPESLDSHWGYVDIKGNVTGKVSERFAEEYVIRETQGIYPRFRITLKRITREVIWVDPNITNSENSGHVQRLKKAPGIFLYATADPGRALEALKKRKPGTEYRAMTAGRGGEDFVKKVRGEGITCKVMVFCGTVRYHKPWADKIKDTAVTASAQTMYSFATWAA